MSDCRHGKHEGNCPECMAEAPEEQYKPYDSKSGDDGLLCAVREYHETIIACNKCTDLLISKPPCSEEAAKIMQNMYKAQSKMFKIAGIDYNGGT